MANVNMEKYTNEERALYNMAREFLRQNGGGDSIEHDIILLAKEITKREEELNKIDAEASFARAENKKLKSQNQTLMKESSDLRERLNKYDQENLALKEGITKYIEPATPIDELTTIFTPEELKVLAKTMIGKISSITVDFYDV